MPNLTAQQQLQILQQQQMMIMMQQQQILMQQQQQQLQQKTQSPQAQQSSAFSFISSPLPATQPQPAATTQNKDPFAFLLKK